MNYKQMNDNELIYLVREYGVEYGNDLFCKYQPLIREIAREYYTNFNNYGYDYDDFLQEANLAFYNAIGLYDENKGAIFFTFVILCIRRKLISFCRMITASTKNLSQDFCVSLDDYYGVNSKMCVSFDNYDFEQNVKSIMYSLPDDLSTVFELRMNGFRHKEICVLLDISISVLDYKLKVLKKHLKRKLHFLCKQQ